MKNEIILLDENEYQRFYLVDFAIKYVKIGSKVVTLTKLFSKYPMHLKDNYMLAEDLTTINKVCISDARTHNERLAFPAFYVLNKTTKEVTLEHSLNNIAGYHTMMIRGGDTSLMYKDETYIRFLRMLNKNIKEEV